MDPSVAIADVYFPRCSAALEKHSINPLVTYNVFIRSKKPYIVCGLQQCADLLEFLGAEVKLLYKDGDLVPAGTETIMLYSGKARQVFDAETFICAIISAQSTAATAMSEIVEAANDKPVFYFGGRHRSPGADLDWCKGAMAGRATAVATVPTAETLGTKAIGTMPHAFCLIAGSTLEASKMFHATHPDIPLVVLLDTFGTELDDAEQLVEYWGEKLYGVRLDTHGGRTMQGCCGDPGVTVEAVNLLREHLDLCGGLDVKIFASSGFTSEKVRKFEALTDAVDAYGVGISKGYVELNATADIIMLNGKRNHKVGRYEDRFEGDNFVT